ncbi:MAG: T9SS type A sorting domain-containing protein [Flavobacteriaceae bacterium]|nr:T9SS type A sorting domain-containing protein [Flavobacteriaceae bacterium]
MKNLDIKIVVVFIISYLFLSWVTTTIDDFFMPGSQPLDSGVFTASTTCDNCHGDYDVNSEPAYTWRGSMMSHSMRDPLYLASLTIANQDAAEAGDLCIRCHSPSGWLEGRSEPTDGSMLNSIDMEEGVTCHFCHRMIDPLSTDQDDLDYMATLSHVPTQHGNGMFVVDTQDIRRGPYDNIQVNHAYKYDSFYQESEMCGTCHDVSNPVFSKAPDGTYQPNTLGQATLDFDKYEMFPVERTYSEWLMSAYNSPTGIPSTAFGGNKANVASCQDCHMPDVTGKGANKNYAPIRSDLGQHDMTGGNTFIPELLKVQYDTNEIDHDALDAGISRAEYMLQNAATMNLNVVTIENGFEASVEIINETGHKLPSGYPEGRRMWINLEAYDSNDNVIWESGAYDSVTATLNKKDTDNNDTKIYECKLGMSQGVADAANANESNTDTYTAGESFHFALNNMVVKDNRIPPRGFTNANFESIQAAPVGYSYPDGAFSDITNYTLPPETFKVEAKLYYQTASKEYIEFLRDKNYTNSLGNDLYNLWFNHGKSEPEEMVEAEFYTDVLSLNHEIDLNSYIKVYPNPASDNVSINFNLNESKNLTLDIYSLTGSKIETVFKYIMLTGNQTLKWKPINYASGTYIMKFDFEDKSVSRYIIIN